MFNINNKMNDNLIVYWLSLVMCLITPTFCSTLPTTSEQPGVAKTSQFYACLQNCANCVQFWEYGLYNGNRCAKRCMRQQGREIVDPDCNNPKMFNYSPRIIDLLLESQRNQQQQQQQPDVSGEEQMLGDQPISPETLKTKNVGRKNVENLKIEEVTESFEVEVKSQHVHYGRSNKSKHSRHHQHRHRDNKNGDGSLFERRKAGPDNAGRHRLHRNRSGRTDAIKNL